MIVTRVIEAPIEAVWETFTDVPGRVRWLSEVDSVDILSARGNQIRWLQTRAARPYPVVEELMLTVVEPGRQCVVSLAPDPLAQDQEPSRLSYVFAPVEVGAHRGDTVVTAMVPEPRPHSIGDRLLGFVVGGFAARTAEGALRTELAALAAACRTRALAGPAAA